MKHIFSENRLGITFLLMSLIFLTPPAFCKSKKNVGIVNSLEGFASNYHKGASEPEGMEVGSKIYIHDRIVTAENSKVQIVFRDDSVVTLGAQSELVIDGDSYRRGKRRTVLSLVEGKVRSVVGKTYSTKGSRFEIRTHTATAGVRGTENIVESKTNPPVTNVYGISSITYVKSSNPKINAELLLGSKNGAKVLPDSPPQPFDFEFDDPAIMDLIGGTSIPDGGDVEGDIEMGVLDIGQSIMGDRDPQNEFEVTEQELGGEAPFDQEVEFDTGPEEQPDQPEHTHHDGYGSGGGNSLYNGD